MALPISCFFPPRQKIRLQTHEKGDALKHDLERTLEAIRGYSPDMSGIMLEPVALNQSFTDSRRDGRMSDAMDIADDDESAFL